LARALRARLRKIGGSLDHPVIFSSEPAINASSHQAIPGAPDARPRATNGTISYLPNIFGFMTAGYAIQQMLKDYKNHLASDKRIYTPINKHHQ